MRNGSRGSSGGTAVALYRHVRAKLIGHGVENSADGQLVLSDKRLFLRFVALERAVREPSFEAVLARVAEIERHAAALGCRQIAFFATMYLSLSPLAPRRYHPDATDPDGRVRKCLDYDRAVGEEERLIGDWARVRYHRRAKHAFRAIHRDHRG